MAVYTDITDAELEAFLAEFDLGQALAFKGIAEGVSNSNFMLETTAGRFILTIYEPRRSRAEDLPYFLGLMHWLADHGFPCPTPLTDRHGEMLKTLCGKPAALVSYLSGVSVKRPKAQHCREAGAGLAALHKAAEGFPGARRNDLGHDAWAGMFAADRAGADRLRPGLASIIEGDLALLAARWPTGLPEGVIHADFFPDNVFFLDGRFAAAIDFYFAATTPWPTTSGSA